MSGQKRDKNDPIHSQDYENLERNRIKVVVTTIAWFTRWIVRNVRMHEIPSIFQFDRIFVLDYIFFFLTIYEFPF